MLNSLPVTIHYYNEASLCLHMRSIDKFIHPYSNTIDYIQIIVFKEIVKSDFGLSHNWILQSAIIITAIMQIAIGIIRVLKMD